MGLVPGFVPPTDNLNTTFACALVVFLWFNYYGLKVHGIGHITHLLNPLGTKAGWFFFWFFGPVEILGLLVRPVTLAVRLACNMIGDHAILFAFAGIFPLLLPIPLRARDFGLYFTDDGILHFVLHLYCIAYGGGRTLVFRRHWK